MHKFCQIGKLLPGCDGAEDIIIDGRLQQGGWANMCEGHHRVMGCGLGVGKGQKFRIDPESGKKLEKLEG